MGERARAATRTAWGFPCTASEAAWSRRWDVGQRPAEPLPPGKGHDAASQQRRGTACCLGTSGRVAAPTKSFDSSRSTPSPAGLDAPRAAGAGGTRGCHAGSLLTPNDAAAAAAPRRPVLASADKRLPAGALGGRCRCGGQRHACAAGRGGGGREGPGRGKHASASSQRDWAMCVSRPEGDMARAASRRGGG